MTGRFGFTLLELVVVLAILGTLGAFVAPSIVAFGVQSGPTMAGSVQRARQRAVLEDRVVIAEVAPGDSVLVWPTGFVSPLSLPDKRTIDPWTGDVR